jgi:Ca2+-binding RTX toxin-like protein
LYGGSGYDELYGNHGSDHLNGYGGNDSLFGGYGIDFLYGSDGTDFLLGGAGDDYLNGYFGHFSNNSNGELDFDTLEGGTGADRFVLGEGFAFYASPVTDEFATILDFSRAEGDKLRVFGNASDYSLDLDIFGGTEISYKGNLIAVVENVTDLNLQLDFNFF